MALTDKLTNIADAIREKTGSTRTMNLEEMAAAVTNIKIPTALSDLNEDETHRTVTDAEKKTWNNKSNFSGNYDDLKNKQLAGTTDELTSTQVYAAVSTGKPVKVQYTDRTYGALSFTAFNVAESLNVIVSQTIVYVNGVYILAELTGDKSNNAWGFNTTTLAQKADIPLKLPNPNALTFTGAAEGSYDGSEALSVEIPSGSGASEGSSQWKIIRDLTISENADRVDVNKDNDGNTFALHEIHVFSYTQSYADASEAYTFLLNGFWNAGDPYFNSGFKSTASSSNYYAENHFIATMQNGFANIFQPWKAGIIGTKPGGDVYSFGDKYQTIESVSFVGKFIAGCRFILVGRVTL